MKKNKVVVAVTCLLIAAFLGGCASTSGTHDHQVQAPFDSYVCFHTSFIKCLQTVQQANVNTFKNKNYSQQFSADSVTVQDADSGKIVTTTDNKYRCRYGVIPYIQTIAQTQNSVAVFISPSIINQIGEQMVTLERVRQACQRNIQLYNSQQDILALLDKEAAAQTALQYLSAKVENANVSTNPTVNVDLSPSEITQFGLTPPAKGASLKVADELLAQRQAVTKLSDQIRNMYKAQKSDISYPRDFDDAQLAIDAILREIGEELLALDSAVVQPADITVEHTYIPNGAWVHQGTIVMSVE